MSQIQYNILNYSYWEHFKYAKDLALILPIDHPKRKQVENELNIILEKMNNVKNI
jgi:hypothetical protein